MENKKSKILVIAFVLTLSLITGCSISTTRNQYYSCPDQSKNTKQTEVGSTQVADTLTYKVMDKD